MISSHFVAAGNWVLSLTTSLDFCVGMLIVKIGGPAYRIGIGGGAASSMVQGENK
jgi:phosphoribosylformylglycinamidine (FGAM) synthase-like enzyme